MSENSNRQPKGIPTGGQFAASARAEAENVSLTNDADDERHYADRDEPTREDLIGPMRDCRECGETLIADPAGSPGVWVHADEDGFPDYDKDLEHDPAPDDEADDLGLTLADRAEAEMTTLMDAENARNGAYDPPEIQPSPYDDAPDDVDVAADAAQEAARLLAEADEPLTAEATYEMNRVAAQRALSETQQGMGQPSTLNMVAVALESSLRATPGEQPAAAAESLHAARQAHDSDGDVTALAAALRAAVEAGDRSIRTFSGRTADQWREEAAASRRRSAESFARSDTDGFLSQWASDRMASKYDFCATIAERGGRLSHPALFALDGNAVPAKLIDTRYGQAWMLLDAEGLSTGEFVNPSKAQSPEKRAVALAKKGYRTGRVMAPMALNHHSGDAFRCDGGYSADNEVVYVIGADGYNPMRAQAEADGGEFNEWYD